MIESAKAYFEEVDNGRLPVELFTPDFEFYFPKYGIGRGPDEFHKFGAGLWTAGYRAKHHRARLTYIVCGRRVIVEGTTEGSDRTGETWNGGETPGGRFCSVFNFTEADRADVYLSRP